MDKFCKDCKHAMLNRAAGMWDNYAECWRIEKVNPVTGDRIRLAFCDLERNSDERGRCGPEGQFFEPRA